MPEQTAPAFTPELAAAITVAKDELAALASANSTYGELIQTAEARLFVDVIEHAPKMARSFRTIAATLPRGISEAGNVNVTKVLEFLSSQDVPVLSRPMASRYFNIGAALNVAPSIVEEFQTAVYTQEDGTYYPGSDDKPAEPSEFTSRDLDTTARRRGPISVRNLVTVAELAKYVATMEKKSNASHTRTIVDGVMMTKDQHEALTQPWQPEQPAAADDGDSEQPEQPEQPEQSTAPATDNGPVAVDYGTEPPAPPVVDNRRNDGAIFGVFATCDDETVRANRDAVDELPPVDLRSDLLFALIADREEAKRTIPTMDMVKADLIDLAARRGLATSGNKAELFERLGGVPAPVEN